MAKIKKILVVRFSSIGDIVLTTPVIRTLKKQLPGSEIHYLTKPQYAGILENNPYLDKVHVLQDDWGHMIAELKREKFDLMIDLHHNLRTRLLRWNLRLPYYSFNKINIQKWLIVNFKVNRLPDKHIVDRYLEAVSRLGVVNDTEGLDYFIPEKDRVHMDDVLPLENLPFVAYAIGGQHTTKKLPEARIRVLAERLDGYLVLIGGKEDREVGDRIADGLDHVINLSGHLTINQSASVLSQARWVISHDTGMMHIAAALGKPIVSIWGNTIPGFGMSPYRAPENSMVAEVRNLPCRPCSKIGFDRCPKGHFKCMNLIDTDAIIEKVKF